MELPAIENNDEIVSESISSSINSVPLTPLIENGLLGSIYYNLDDGSKEWIAFKTLCNASGFNVRKSRTKTVNKSNSDADYRTMACSKADKPSQKHKNGCKCPWAINLKLRGSAPNQYWQCILHTHTHNHPLMPVDYIKLLGANRSIPAEIKAIIRQLAQSCYGVSISTMYSLLPVMYPDVDTSTYNKIDLQNLMTSIRNENRTEFDAQRLVDELTLAKREDPGFYFKYKANGKCLVCIRMLPMYICILPCMNVYTVYECIHSI